MGNMHALTLRVAGLQLNTTSNIDDNKALVSSLFDQASDANCQLAVLPELCLYRPPSFKGYSGESLDGDIMTYFYEKAKEHQMAVIVGSFAEKAPNKKLYNTSVYIDPDGNVQGIYRKRHLFNVNYQSMVVNESRTFLAGHENRLVEYVSWKIGLSICFDLRFPNMYSDYKHAGAHILTIPASFTTVTGRDHWEVLIRSRAIENQCYVIAPNQFGAGARGIDTYGHTMIVDPWGKIICQETNMKNAVVVADLDLSYCEHVRQSLPCNKN